jgi:hypothetical protein
LTPPASDDIAHAGHNCPVPFFTTAIIDADGAIRFTLTNSRRNRLKEHCFSFQLRETDTPRVKVDLFPF